MELIFKPLSEFSEADESYFLPWKLDILYQVEPELRQIADKALAHKRQGFYKRIDAYTTAKNEAENLVGWFARDPRLRSSGAWDCFFHHVREELKL